MRAVPLLSLAFVLTLSACKGPGFTNAAPQTVLACDYKALEKNSRREGPAILSEAYGSVSAIPLGAVVVADPRLFKSVITQTVASEASDGSTARVTVRFANCTGYAFVFQARTHFLKESGAPAEPASGWSPVHIGPGLTTVYQESSISRSDKVQGFYVEIAPM